MLKVLSLFDGISCGALALAGIPNVYYSSEIDRKALEVSAFHWPNHVRLGDVRGIRALESPIDLLIGGSPCQSFSKAGDGTGFEGKSGIFWEYVRVLRELRPTWFLLENVKMKGIWRDQISEALGVEPVLINSNTFTAQNRPRYYWTNIPVRPYADLGATLPEGVCYTEARSDAAKEARREARKSGKDWCPRRGKILVPRKDGKANCLTATESRKEHMLNVGGLDRLMTAEEWEDLQGLPKGYTGVTGLSDGARKRLIGNGWTVPVIAHILGGIPTST